MAENKQKLKPDIVLKEYWRNNEQFADFFNAVLFDGKQMIKPDELCDIDSESSYIEEHRKYTSSIEASRDNIKEWKQHGVAFAMYGQEAQEHIHYAMPMRIMGYDYGTYKRQYEMNKAKYKEGDLKDRDEFLSKMKKTDKFIPVITVVVYYGDKVWDGAVSLHGMLNIPESLEKFVNDYKKIF